MLPLSLATLPLIPPSSNAPPTHLVLPTPSSQVETTLTWQAQPKPAVTEAKATEPTVPLPFCLASCLPPVPAKLVKRIQALEFVEMRELLPDNMALAERLEALPLRMGPVAKQAEQREVGSLMTRVSSFTTYVAIVAEVHPQRVRDMLAYMRLIIREAHKHGGQGWLTYDAVFRRNHQGLAQQWNILDPSLHTAYIAGQSLRPRVPCRHCNEADHHPEDCALAPIVQPFRTSPRDHAPVSTRSTKRPPTPSWSQPSSKRLCFSWNRGPCSFPGVCSYRHVCTLCDSQSHKAKDCSRAPPLQYKPTQWPSITLQNRSRGVPPDRVSCKV